MSSEGRRLAIYLCLITSVTGFLQPFVPIYLFESGLTKGQIGIVAGAGAALAFPIQMALGRLSDHLDSRRPFVALMATVAGISYFSFPWLHGLPAFLIAVALGANATMYLQGVGGVLVGRMTSKQQGGAAYANLRIWGSIGYVFVAIAVGLLLHGSGDIAHGRAPYNLLFHILPLMFFGIAGFAYWIPDAKRPVSDEPRPKLVRINPNLARFLAVDFLYIVSLYGATNFISIYMQQLGGRGLLLSCVFIPGVIGEILVMRRSGAFSDRYGRRPILAFSYLLLPLRLLLYAPATGPYWLLAVQSMHGFNFGIVGAVAIAFVNDQADHHTRGALQARLSLVTASAGAVGPILMGGVAQRFGLPTMFVVAAGIAAIACAFFLLFIDESNDHARGTGVRWLDHAPLSKWFKRTA